MLFRRVSMAATLVCVAAAQDSEADRFEKRIRPVLASRCYACHSGTGAAPQGGLRLDSVAGIRKGGNTGPLLEPGKPDESLLLRALRHTDKAMKMPPGAPLPPEVVQEFEAWIRAGAVMPEDVMPVSSKAAGLWSLERPRRAPAPKVQQTDRVRNEIDAFVLSRLEAKGLRPAPEADRRTLIRRLSYDLTGLPPRAEEIEQFVADKSADAYEKLVDRLLASPQYGERWARHWLDVARYADSFNDSVNTGQRYPWSYSYRDWVIQSFNEDLPYDEFVLYQIAADRVPGVESRHLAALGFLSLGREFPNSYVETVDDRIDAVTRGMLGLTVACARCHDHKYDPIPTRDYYSLYAVLSNIRTPKELPSIGKADAVFARRKVYEQRLANIEKVHQDYRKRRHAEMLTFFKTQIAEYMLAARDAEKLTNAEIEELVRDRQLNLHVLRRWRTYLRKSKASDDPVFQIWHVAGTAGNAIVSAAVEQSRIRDARDLAQVYASVLTKYDRAEREQDPAAEELLAVMRGPESPWNVPLDEFELICTEGDNNNLRSIKVRYNDMLVQSAYDGAPPRAMAVEDVPDPVPAQVFLRGNPNNPGAPVQARFLSSLGGVDEKPFKDRRLDLARAIIDPQNPLTARVIVNRVWMHHFGQGLVRTPSDFGVRGEKPTHPELLDYLAVRFVESGWSIKQLHRWILHSSTYRQAADDNEIARKVDPENLLLWRMNRRRLEIESLRDSMLAVAGRLEGTRGGLPFSLTAIPSVPRRSVYGFIERGRVPGVLNAFDFASPDQHAPMRFVTTVPQQSLFFLNSPFVAEQARHIAKQMDGMQDGSARVAALYRRLFGREPEQREIAAGLQFVARDGGAPKAPARSPWRYGTWGEHGFAPFATFTGDAWQGSAELLDRRSGYALLTPTGGMPGEHSHQAVSRRWVSPVKGRISIEGTLRHGQGAVPYGNGVRGRVISSRLGEIASWVVNGSSAETRMNGIAVEAGDTIDFVVDARTEPENDAFGWAPEIVFGEQRWSARNEFAGPPPEPLDVWARYVQVLLQTNEFAFVD